jgi:mono/diheme cytochrome c family protein
MPDMLASKSESERLAIAEALAHFMISQSQPRAPASEVSDADPRQGEALFHSVGCVACHGPKALVPGAAQDVSSSEEDEEAELEPSRAARKAIRPSAVPLEHVPAKYTARSLSAFLFEPLRVRSSGRMPDMKLTPSESLAIASYLVGEPRSSVQPMIMDPALVAAGKKHFESLNCAACHALRGIQALPSSGDLKTADLQRGCLAMDTASRTDAQQRKSSPRFQLDAEPIAAMVAAIRAEATEDSDQERLAMTLTAFRCIQCHVRDDYGGVHDSHNAFFQGSQLNLGDDGRIPPPLTLMGAKLQSAWLKKVLFDGESVRHYMATRMPQYGAKNLAEVPELFRRLDALNAPEMHLPSPESRDEQEQQREKRMRAAGRELLGDKAANCVACHAFNGKAASTHQGIDLLTSFERLQPAWFYRYLQKPSAFRPRTVMPSAWPDGVATFTTVLDGDTHQQIEAIWYYLSLGTSAADPSGVRAVGTKLEVGETAVLHRGRSRVAGFRGIAVGLPGKLNYAFNAETGTLSALWEGDFVHVNWSGQGSGDFNPASQPIQLAQDVSFAPLPDAKAPWPLLPVMTKEQPVNPDPLYPKNLGYQFRGVALDASFVPTFFYQCGRVQIEDRTGAMVQETKRGLKRVITFRSEEPQSIWFRGLTGDIQRESDWVYRSGRLRITVPDANASLRSATEQPDRQELLLRLNILHGESTLEIEYELLK